MNYKEKLNRLYENVINKNISFRDCKKSLKERKWKPFDAIEKPKTIINSFKRYLKKYPEVGYLNSINDYLKDNPATDKVTEEKIRKILGDWADKNSDWLSKVLGY